MAQEVMNKGASGLVGAARPALDVQLKRYERSYRRRLRKLAKSSPRLGDLIYSFPAAAFVLAAGPGPLHGNQFACRDGLDRVKQGADLRAVASALGLAAWTRRLPPEALSTALQCLPAGSPDFDRQIVNFIPDDHDQARFWLIWIAKANALAGEAFALWLARQRIWVYVRDENAELVALAAYAWFSSSQGSTARGFIREPFAPSMGFAKAVEAARDWFMRVMLEHCLELRPDTGRWLVEQRVSGFRIVPLRTEKELLLEGERMTNCVASYYSKVATGECLIYGIRRGHEHLATMEIRPNLQLDGFAIVAQLLGPGNMPVTEDISRAARTWLGRQGRYPYLSGLVLDQMSISNWRWSELWMPYREARRPCELSSDRAVGQQAHALYRSLKGLVAIAAAGR